jgi:hypothetical protein
MEPFYITGQKRVGKTSLALAVAQFATKQSVKYHPIEYKEILWGRIAHESAKQSLKGLGETVEQFLLSSLPPEQRTGGLSYEGSLAGILRISDKLLDAAPERRFVIIIDEFDEIPQDLFLYGTLAETFFSNLRTITASKNICLILVGGENMPFIMARQGQKLNKLSRYDLNYFSRDLEWEDYKLLVRQPTKSVINWHDDAIGEVYNVTNGNPYFTKVICAAVLRKAVQERDADITVMEVRRAIETEVSALSENSFMHLWQDGIFKPLEEREPDFLRRMNVLVAIARCLRKGLPPTSTNIADAKHSTSLTATDVVATLNDFVRRGVLHQEKEAYAFNLPLFRMWLVDVGITRLIADPLSEELAQSIQAEEDRAHVNSAEIVLVAQKWPTYRGRHIGTEEIRAWLEQVDGNRERRLLFKLLGSLNFYSEAQVRERLRTAFAIIRPSLPEFVIRRQSDRRKDVLVTYVDGEGKSGQYYASQFAEENRIAVDCVKSPLRFAEGFRQHTSTHGPIAGVTIVDDIAATGKSMAGNLASFIAENREVLEVATVGVFAVAIIATVVGDKKIREALSKVERVRADFRACQILGAEGFAFDPENRIWEDGDELERAKALCSDLGTRIYPQAPLGFGNQGLLVVFPTTVPNNTLPILHSYSKASSVGKRWMPLFERVTN